ncbi:MAG: class I adenylate-forming enzyme family protein [Terrimicrobiaceae bacterium]|nr:class I adenylate-forming enzyme family protein [Terrimicrobiaceae bacterium]
MNLKAAVLLDAWSRTLASAADGAIFGPDGRLLRTWHDIEDEACHFAGLLASPTPSAVVLQTGNHAGFPAALLGAWRAGRPVVLVDAGLAAPVREQVERDIHAGTRIVAAGKDLEFLDLENGAVTPESRADLYKLTSGTTSRPSLLPFTAAQLLADCENVCESMEIRATDRNFGVVAFTHSYGFSNLVTPLIARGIPLVAATDALPRALAAGLLNSGATVLPAVPAMFRALLTVEALPEQLRLCISAGAPLDARLAAEFHGRFGRKLHSFYGASECGGIAFDASDDPCPPTGFVGTALKGVDLGLEPSGDGVWRARVRSDAVGLTSSDGVYEPADLLEKTPRGLRLIGRDSDLINVGGRKVSPAYVEEALGHHPGVRAAVVFGVPREGGGEWVAALVVTEPGTTAADLRAHCASRLAPWERPREFHFSEKIPTNERGKISRRDLAARYAPPAL